MTSYGGQAVLEGVMMRGTQAMAVAVRDPQGEIITHIEPLNQTVYGGRIARLPFVRGLTLLWDALGLGVKALMFSAEVSVQDPAPSVASSSKAEEAKAIFDAPAQVGTVLLSLTMAVAIFIALPAFLAGLIERWLGAGQSAFWSNLIEGVIRLVITIGYIAAMGLVPEFKRLFGYHGAEHKTINAFEAGAPMTPESVARFPLEHPRCGTAFLLTVIVTSIVIYSFLPRLTLVWRVLSRLILVPLIAGISYEFLRFTGRHQQNPVIRMIIVPNLAMQRLTTREPDREMLEVAIVSFEKMLASERLQPVL